MGTYVAPFTTIRTARVLVGLVAAAFLGSLALGVALAVRAISFDSVPTKPSQGTLVRMHPGYGTDYPPHHGLAGPSGVVRGDAPLRGRANAVGSGSAQRGYGTDYPPHHGLAGPSTVASSQ